GSAGSRGRSGMGGGGAVAGWGRCWRRCWRRGSSGGCRAQRGGGSGAGPAERAGRGHLGPEADADGLGLGFSGMDEADRQVLRRCRLRLVCELQVDSLWDHLLDRELFTRDMIEDIQVRPHPRPAGAPWSLRGSWLRVADGEGEARAGSGSRRDQARQLVTDLESRGSRALPLFISCLEDTGQGALASFMRTSCQPAKWDSEVIRPLDFEPGVLPPRDLKPVAPAGPADMSPGRFTSICVLEPSKGNADLAYLLKADPCGHCLIINNVSFHPESKLSVRTGSDVDCEKLQRRFGLLHFEVKVEKNLTAKQMDRALLELAKQDHGALDCCVVVILSHGCQASHRQFPGAVYGVDGCPVSVERIVNIFNGTGCPSLRGKPKLFFIQACGGEQRDPGFSVASTPLRGRAPDGVPESDAAPFRDGRGTFDQTDAVASLPTPSDIFVSYSTFPGFVSWRDKTSGSWYVETLDRVLEQWAHADDLQTLLLRVADAVSERGILKQMPGCFNFLRKKLFFKTLGAGPALSPLTPDSLQTQAKWQTQRKRSSHHGRHVALRLGRSPLRAHTGENQVNGQSRAAGLFPGSLLRTCTSLGLRAALTWGALAARERGRKGYDHGFAVTRWGLLVKRDLAWSPGLGGEQCCELLQTQLLRPMCMNAIRSLLQLESGKQGADERVCLLLVLRNITELLKRMTKVHVLPSACEWLQAAHDVAVGCDH
ncbi:Caspase-9, partial [Galemys pyrenaicus]